MQPFNKVWAIALMTTAMMASSCSQQKNNQPAPAQTTGEKSDMTARIAYVEVDSVMQNYEFCKDYAQVLTKKTETIQNTLNSKGLALQKQVADFQSKVQSGLYTREQAEAEQDALQKKQVQLQNLQQSLAAEFEKEQTHYNDALRDSLHNFLKKYNESFGYNYIISKAGDNILLADKRFDITEDVIKGLNKRYKRPTKIKKELEK